MTVFIGWPILNEKQNDRPIFGQASLRSILWNYVDCLKWKLIVRKTILYTLKADF